MGRRLADRRESLHEDAVHAARIALVRADPQALADVADAREDDFPEIVRFGMAFGPDGLDAIHDPVGPDDIQVILEEGAFIPAAGPERIDKFSLLPLNA